MIKKKIVLVVIILLAISTTAIGVSMVEGVYFNNYKISVDGDNYTPELPILNYQDRTYVPLRELANLTGSYVDFEDDTIYVIKPGSGLQCTIWALSLLSELHGDITGMRCVYNSIGYCVSGVEKTLLEVLQTWTEAADDNINWLKDLYPVYVGEDYKEVLDVAEDYVWNVKLQMDYANNYYNKYGYITEDIIMTNQDIITEKFDNYCDVMYEFQLKVFNNNYPFYLKYMQYNEE